VEVVLAVKQRLGHGAGARAAKCAATEVARASQRDARANRVAMRARARDASDASDEDDASTSDAPRARASGRRALDYVRFDDGNAHGRAFERSALRRTMARDPAFDSMARHRKVKKEITEAHGALAQVRRALRAGGGGGEDGGGDGDGLVLIELCSGRGFVSLVLADAFPKARIYMIDRDTTMDVSHVETYGGARMSFHALDLHSTACEEFVRGVADDAETRGQTVVLVGVHLCGTLSHRAIELYERIERAVAIVVAPCCLPQRRRHDVFGFHCKDIARSIGNGVTPFQCWCTQLYFRLPLTSKRNMTIDHDVLSTQNTFLVARRPLDSALDALSISTPLSPSIVPGRSCAKWRLVK